MISDPEETWSAVYSPAAKEEPGWKACPKLFLNLSPSVHSPAARVDPNLQCDQ